MLALLLLAQLIYRVVVNGCVARGWYVFYYLHHIGGIEVLTSEVFVCTTTVLPCSPT